MSAKKHELKINDRYFNLVIIGEPIKRNTSRYILCRCDCGTVKEMDFYSISKGLTKSCGCHRRNLCIKRSTKHGDKSRSNPSRLYKTWTDMKDRCSNLNKWNYENYGGRGISVCQEWQDDFIKFKDWALVSGYSSNLQINRIDNDGNYGPDNCNWVTNKQNSRNRRSNRMLAALNETKSIAEWIEDPRCSINYTSLQQRIASNWDIEYAIISPPKSRKITRKEND